MANDKLNLAEELAFIYSLLLGIYGLQTLTKEEQDQMVPIVRATFNSIQEKLVSLSAHLDIESAGELLSSLTGNVYVDPGKGSGNGEAH